MKTFSHPIVDSSTCLRLELEGTVQGVGFRPFVFRLANELSLKGIVRNTLRGVLIEVEGTQEGLELFHHRLLQEKPNNASIRSVKKTYLHPQRYTVFQIKESRNTGQVEPVITPDIATCKDCLREIRDPTNRRYRYPFTNCIHCGPRYSILEKLPYDRAHTSMRNFAMCEQCQAEFENPIDRRFHAQANACPGCGPHLELWDRNGSILESHDQALKMAADAIRKGQIVAVKGIGGFHLVTNGAYEPGIKTLRLRKRRTEKPFAVMFSSIEEVLKYCKVSNDEERLLHSPECPIVILKRSGTNEFCEPACSIFGLSKQIAPRNPTLGVLLPYTPLHHLLLQEVGNPVVATSGNISDESICVDEREALERLYNIADLFLVHNRPIVHRVDDSIVCVIAGRELVLRRARGYAPLCLNLNSEPPSIISVGAQLKNTVAATVGKTIVLSPHLGDLGSLQTYSQFKHTIHDVQKFYDLTPSAIVCDKHPDYLSSHFAETGEMPVIRVQHHYAHIRSCMAENELTGSILGVAWDGTGYGDDGTIWGGEFFIVTDSNYTRCASIQPFLLPGGDYAVREPRRSALGLLYAYFGNEIWEWKSLIEPLKSFTNTEYEVLKSMLEKKLNTPAISSVGRLFDAVAAILGLRQFTEFEGQAAMELEFAIDGFNTNETYHFQLDKEDSSNEKIPTSLVNLKPMLKELLSDVHHGRSTSLLSTRFHNTMVEIILALAKSVGEERVVLSGGCFQNKYLTEQTITRLLREGFQPYWHKLIPPNDGGISLGQIVAAERLLRFPH